ncbi:flagellar hook assembly protein FlgD [Hahella sp. SMD15-11]|uniref:Basal-body rod modification protein FlgD n=1 Tax=Thermohahella caldifontis TaxID=3142973 RepID=A0AB39UY17_9GAMM
MADIQSLNASSDVLAKYAIQQESKKSNELGQNQFMELMIAQLKNQSPLEPQDNSEFVAQLAQFSSVEGIEKLNQSVDSVASQFRSNQALQASAMVGRNVLVPNAQGVLGPEGRISGVIEVPGSTSSLTVSILNPSGELVKRMELGQQPAGDIRFEWDGTNAKGESMPAGLYTVKAEARYGSETQQLNAYMAANVDSVSISQTGSILLNLAGMGQASLSDVKEIL